VQRDHVAATEAPGGERGGDGVGLGGERRVGRGGAAVADRDLVRVPDQAGRDVGGQRGGGGRRRRRVPRRELGLLVGRHRQQLAHRAGGIGGDGGDQREEAPGQALRGVGAEDVGVVVEAADHAVDPVEEPQRDVLGRGGLEHRQVAVLQVAPLRRPLPRVLVREERLVDREPRLVAAHVERAHQVLERHVLGAERLERGGADRADQLEEAARGIDGEAQRQRVHEEAGDRLDVGQVAPAHRRADHQLGLAGLLMQEHGPRAEQRHEQGRALAQARGAQRVGDRRRQAQPLGVAAAAHLRRPRLIGGQIEGLGRAGQRALPVRELTLELGAGHPVAVPGGEVGVAHRQRRAGRRGAALERAVEIGHVLVEQVERPAVPDRVVRHEEQHVVIVGEAEQARAEERRDRELERHRDQLGQAALERRLALGLGEVGEIVERQRGVDGVEHDLGRAVADHADHRAQHGLALDQRGERVLEGAAIEGAAEVMRARHVEHRAAELELLEVPDPLLHERQRRRAGVGAARDARRRGDLGGALAVEPGGQARHGGVLEHHAHRHRAPELLAQARGELRDQERVTAEREEVVVDR
jgi:hypothetical protein